MYLVILKNAGNHRNSSSFYSQSICIFQAKDMIYDKKSVQINHQYSGSISFYYYCDLNEDQRNIWK